MQSTWTFLYIPSTPIVLVPFYKENIGNQFFTGAEHDQYFVNKLEYILTKTFIAFLEKHECFKFRSSKKIIALNSHHEVVKVHWHDTL